MTNLLKKTIILKRNSFFKLFKAFFWDKGSPGPKTKWRPTVPLKKMTQKNTQKKTKSAPLSSKINEIVEKNFFVSHRIVFFSFWVFLWVVENTAKKNKTKWRPLDSLKSPKNTQKKTKSAPFALVIDEVIEKKIVFLYFFKVFFFLGGGGGGVRGIPGPAKKNKTKWRPA